VTQVNVLVKMSCKSHIWAEIRRQYYPVAVSFLLSPYLSGALSVYRPLGFVSLGFCDRSDCRMAGFTTHDLLLGI
jgi:hypothetical protein